MPELKALRELRYGGKTIFPGEGFEASEKEAKLLKAIGKATDGEVANKTDLPKAATAPEPAPEPDPVPLQDAGHYQRRDMRAEDGQTGEETSPASSRRGRRRKAQTSDDSEE